MIDQFNEELRRLRRTMRDLVALSTLPAVWTGLDTEGIGNSLAEVLLRTLSLDLVYIRLKGSGPEEVIEIVRGKHGIDAAAADAVKAALKPLLNIDASDTPPPIANPFTKTGTLRVAVTRFGISGDHGVLVSASSHATFPTEQDRILLGVGANQTAIVVQRNKADREAREQAERLRTILSSIGDAVITTDIEGKITFLNPIAEAMTQWKLSEAKGKLLDTLFEIINEITRKPVENPVRKVLNEGVSVALDHAALIARDGTETSIADSAAPIRDAHGNITGAVMVFHDVSEEREAEALLRDTRDRLEATLNSAEIGTWTWDIPAGRIVADRNLARMFSIKGEYAAGLPVASYLSAVYEGDRNRVENTIAEAMRSESGDYQTDYRLLRPDGTLRWVAARGKVQRDLNGEPATLHGVVLDISERKLAEEAALELSSRLQLALNAGQMGTWEWIIPTGQVRWSKTLEAIHGLPEGTFGGTFDDFQRDIHPEDRPRVLSAIQKCVECREDHHIEYRIIIPGGQVLWIEARGRLIIDADGKLERMSGVCMNVTARKMAQEALAKSEQFNRTIIESSRDCTKTLSLDGTLEWINESGCRTLCLNDPREIIGKSWIDFWKQEDDRIAAKKAVETAAAGGIGTLVGRLAVNGELKSWDVVITPILNARGKPERLLAISRDVTERAKAEEISLRLAAVVESSDDAIISKTLDGTISTWNRGAEKMFGYSPAEAIGKSIYLLVPPDRVEEEANILSRLTCGQCIEHFETVRRRKDGSCLDISLSVSPIKNSSGKIIGASKISRDITQQKRIADALRHSEEELRALADSIPQLAWMADSAGDIFWYNQRWYEYTGTTLEQMKGWGWKSVHDPLVLPEVMERWETSIRTGKSFEMEFPLKGADGAFRWFLTRVNPLRARDGKVYRWFGTNTDIDQFRKTQVALRDETLALELLNSTGIAVSATLDLQSLVQTVTDAGRKLVGAQFGAFFYNVLDEKGESFLLYSLSGAPREAFDKFGLPRNTAVFEPTFRGKAIVRSGDITQDPRYGKMAPHHGMPKGHLPVRSYLAASVISRSGEVIGGLFFGHSEPDVFGNRTERIIAGVAAQAAISIDNARLFEAAQREITERKRAEQVMLSAKNDAEKANRAKDEFLAVLSHELRTPLTSILGWVRMLRSSELEENDQARALEVIERNTLAQTRLIEDLLDVSRIISGKLVLTLQTSNLPLIVNAAVDAVRPAATSKGIHLKWHISNADMESAVDADRMQQVVYNLLTNAIKFTPKGGTISVEAKRLDAHFEISVADTGIGMEAEFVPFVFDRFRQADASITRLYQGLGLGLSIVRHLVELHGGTVHAESPGKDKGSVFRIRLPVQAQRMGAAIEYKPASSHSLSAVTTPVNLKGLRILVVEDEPDARDMLKTILEQSGARVRAAGSVSDALKITEDFNPQFLLSDLGLPGEDGFSLMKRLRASKRWERLPAVALTAYAKPEDRVRVLSAGFQSHIAKPVEPAELIALIANLSRSSSS